MKIGILGAGLTGLEIGRRLGMSGEDFVIFEKEPQMGGLCRTIKSGDYYWDFAVHALYSRNKEVTDYLLSLPLDYRHLNRNAKVFHRGRNGKRRVIEYPFENGVRELSPPEKLECIWGYLIAKSRKTEIHNLRQWMDRHAGSGIAKYFMIPYNHKLWNCGIAEISDSLVDTRVEPAPALKFIKGALWAKTVGREYQSRFIYPRGGIQELIDYTSKEIKDRILLRSPVERLSKQGDRWIIITAGGAYPVDAIVSTIPLVDLLRMIDVAGVQKEYEELKWNDTYFVMIGLARDSRFRLIDNCQWVFFAGDEIFYRITLMHNFSDLFLPTLVAEVTAKGDALGKAEGEITELVVRDLLRLGIVRAQNEIAHTDIRLVKHTYAIPTINSDSVKKRINDALRPHGLFLLGRNGNWDYLNMDGVLQKVEEFYEKIIKHDLMTRS